MGGGDARDKGMSHRMGMIGREWGRRSGADQSIVIKVEEGWRGSVDTYKSRGGVARIYRYTYNRNFQKVDIDTYTSIQPKSIHIYNRTILIKVDIDTLLLNTLY